MGVVGFSRVCAALLAVRWWFRRHQCRNATMFGSLRRFSLVLNAFIASPYGFQRRQSMTRQTNYRASVRNGAPPGQRRRRLLNLSFDETDRLLYPTRAMAATCPIHRDEGSVAVFKGLSRRILDLADLRKFSARMAVPYRALRSRTPCSNKPLQRFRSVGAAGEITWPTAVSRLTEVDTEPRGAAGARGLPSAGGQDSRFPRSGIKTACTSMGID